MHGDAEGTIIVWKPRRNVPTRWPRIDLSRVGRSCCEFGRRGMNILQVEMTKRQRYLHEQCQQAEPCTPTPPRAPPVHVPHSPGCMSQGAPVGDPATLRGSCGFFTTDGERHTLSDKAPRAGIAFAPMMSLSSVQLLPAFARFGSILHDVSTAKAQASTRGFSMPLLRGAEMPQGSLGCARSRRGRSRLRRSQRLALLRNGGARRPASNAVNPACPPLS